MRGGKVMTKNAAHQGYLYLELKTWNNLSQAEIDSRLDKSMADLSAGRVISQEQLDAKIRERFHRHY